MTLDGGIMLRKTAAEDLPILFTFQLDRDANYMAAFTSNDPTDKIAYLRKYTKFLDDPTINMMTIICDHVIVGSIAKFEVEHEAEVTYWIDKKYWSRGIASKALKGFLTIEHARPLFGRAAMDNGASHSVMEKCGFVKIGSDRGFANARQIEVEEYVYKLV